jgi:hypothetical protein
VTFWVRAWKAGEIDDLDQQKAPVMADQLAVKFRLDRRP